MEVVQWRETLEGEGLAQRLVAAEQKTALLDERINQGTSSLLEKLCALEVAIMAAYFVYMQG